MNQKDKLRNQIEQERTKLNELLTNGKSIEDAYFQSRVVDRLIEQYMELC